MRFKSILDDALTEYQKKTKKNLLDYWLATELKGCESIDAVLDIFRDQAKAIERTSAADRRLMERIGSSVNVLSSISDTLGEGIGLTFPPAKVIFAGISVLLSAAKGVKASHDALADLFGRIEDFFKRFEVYIESSPTTELLEVLVKVVVEVLSILSIAMKEMEQSLTKQYLKKLVGGTDIEDGLKKLDNLIRGEYGMVTAQVLRVTSKIKEDVKELVLAIEQMAKKAGRDEWNKTRERARIWISPPDGPDPLTNHNTACKAYHKGTATWFFGGSMFKEWMSRGSLLWVHGKPGSGKSILCSAIIRHIMALCWPRKPHLAYFYFDFRDEKKQNARNLIISLLSQLSTFSDASRDVIALLYSTHGNGTQKPTDDDLTECLKQMLSVLAEYPIYIVADALDECPDDSGWPKTPREEVLDVVQDLVSVHLPNLRICVTSRPEVDIKSILNQLTIHTVSLHDQSEQQKGIADYISTIVNSDRRMREWPVEDKGLVIKELSERADGMFRWVVCQLETLRRSVQRNLPGILSKLPKTLDETYERVLRDIHEDNQEHTRRLLHCLAVSVRPLRVEELAEILAFDFDTAEGDIPEYHADWRWKDQEEAVLSTCSSLITIADYNDHYGSRWRVVQFSHFSVKEFLMSDRLATPTRDVSRHRILPRPAHTILVQACLGFLLHSDGHMTHIDAERAKAFPLAKYAAEHWVTHAKFQDVASYVKYGMKDLFDPEMPYFASWVGTHNIDELVGSFGKCTLPTPLYYSALCGFHDIAKDLSVKYPHHVNAIGGGYDSPLGAALSQGHVRVAELLLEHGGDLEVRGPRGHTPLHTLLLHNDHDNKDSFMDGVQLLLKRGSNANTRDEGHQTPLHTLLRPENLAWSRDHNPDDYILVVAQLLLEHGADVNARCNVHTTPLLLATQHGAFNIACCLLEHGADPNFVYEEDKTLLHLLFHHFSMIHTHAFARLLLKHGADMNPRDNVNNTPLLLAVQHNSFDDARFLLEHGADPNLVYNEGKTLLHLLLGAYDSSWGFFSGFGHYRNDCILSQAQLLIKHGADVDARDNVHKTPLLLAFQYSLLNVIQFFLKHGANPNLVYEEGKTLLHLLLGAHDDSGWGSVWGFGRRRDNRILFAARLLLEYGADVNARDDTHETPLFLAFQHDAPNVTLLELGVNPNLQSSEGNTPLYTPPLEHDNDNDNDVIILQLLLEHGADTSAINKNHVTPLDLAPYYGKVAIVQELLDHANESEDCAVGVNAPDKDHAALLRLACYCGRLDVVHELLNNGAKANSENFLGENALHLLSQGEYGSQEDGVRIVRELVERGVDINAQCKHYRTPLHLVSYFGRPAATQVLLDYSAKPNVMDEHGEIPLHLLSRGKYYSQDDAVRVALLLIECGADVNARDMKLRTPLHNASYNGNVAIAQVLLEHRGTPHARDSNGESPLHLVLQGKDDSEECGTIARLLLEHGADVDAQDGRNVTPLDLSSRLQKPKIAKMLAEHRKTRARTRKADFSQEIASKRIRPGQSNPVAEALGGNSRDDSMEL